MRITSFMAAAALVAIGCDRVAAVSVWTEPVLANSTQARTSSPLTNSRLENSGAFSAMTVDGTAEWREITLPAGTQLSVRLDTGVGSDTSRVEQPVTAHLTRAVRVRGETVVPEGSRVTGIVTDAKRSAKVKGRARVALRFDGLTPRGEEQRYAIRTAQVARTAAATKQKDAIEIGAPAAGGAIIGALVGGKKGALIGTAVGGGAGTAAVLSTRGKEVRLSKGAPLVLRLAAPVTIRVRS
jgi:hypothetical protein